MGVVSQKRFLRGINAAVDILSQPQGSVPRVTNMLYNVRGSLKTCDGSKILGRYTDTSDYFNRGPMTECFLYQPIGLDRYYVIFYKDYGIHLGVPLAPAVVLGAAGGTLAAATYYYVITTLDGAGGESTSSSEVNVVNPGAFKNELTWTPKTNSNGYNVYRGTAPGTEVFLAKATSAAYSDDGSATPGTATPPLYDNTQLCQFVKVPSDGTYDAADILHTFPADNISADIGLDDGGWGGGGGGGGIGDGSGGTDTSGSTGGGQTPGGGIAGNVSPLPMMVQFVNKVVLALGNGYPIYLYDGTTTTEVTNTFNSVYPDWQTATTYSPDDIIKDSVSGYLFKATQGGTSAAGRPAFPTVLNETISDNKIIWQNVGSYNAPPAPPGAAHVVVYAGSLWAFNTSPTATDIDGPSALRMSDVNNPNSWNPLNAAQLSKDDGSQGMGLSAFTIAEQGVAPTGSLIAFKEFSTFQIVGVFGSSNFAIQQAKTDMGCIAPRSIQFIPGYGIARLTHLGVAIFNGVSDQLISEEIRPYLFDNVQDDIYSMDWNYAYFSKASQVAVPPMYVLAIPVALPTITISSVAVEAHVGANLTPAVYYIRVTKVAKKTVVQDQQFGGLTQSQESAVSIQYGPFSITGINQGIRVIGESNDEHTQSWRIYYGPGIGLQDHYLDAASIDGGGVLIDGVTGVIQPVAPGVGAGGLSRILCYDLVLKAWAIIDLPFTISVLRQFRATGTIPITVTGGFVDGTIRRIQSGDEDWDGVEITWAFRTPECYGQGASQKLHFRRIIIKGVGDGTVIEATPIIDGTSNETRFPRNYPQGRNMFSSWFELFDEPEGQSASSDIYGSGMVQIDGVDWTINPKPSGTPPVIS